MSARVEVGECLVCGETLNAYIEYEITVVTPDALCVPSVRPVKAHYGAHHCRRDNDPPRPRGAR